MRFFWLFLTVSCVAFPIIFCFCFLVILFTCEGYNLVVFNIGWCLKLSIYETEGEEKEREKERDRESDRVRVKESD